MDSIDRVNEAFNQIKLALADEVVWLVENGYTSESKTFCDHITEIGKLRKRINGHLETITAEQHVSA